MDTDMQLLPQMTAGEKVIFWATAALAILALWLLAFQVMPTTFQAIQMANGFTALVVGPPVMRSFGQKQDLVGFLACGFGFPIAAVVSFYLAISPIFS
jgi:hypothetical protein